MSAPTGSMIPKSNISGYKQRQIPQFTPEQMNLFQMLLGGAQGGLGGGLDFLSGLAGGDEGMFKQMEAPAFRQLQGQLGQLGSRFADVGALGSSGFQQMASGATTDLSERLQSQRTGLQQGAIDKLLGLSQNLLGQRPYEQYYEQEPDYLGMLGKLLGGIGGSFGGPFLGALGGGLGEAALKKLLGK